MLAGFFLHPEASEEDRSWVLELALPGGDTVLFSRLYNLLPDEEKEQRGIALQKGSLLAQLGRTGESVRLARELAERWPGDEGCRSFLAKALFQRGKREDYREGQEIVGELLSSSTFPLASKRVLLTLLWSVPLDHWDREKWKSAQDLVGNLPDRTVSESLLLRPLLSPALSSPAFEPWSVETSSSFWQEDAVAVADWFLFLRRPELALAQWEPESTEESPLLFQKRFDLLVAAERWEEAELWLEEAPTTIEPVRLWLARARVAEALGQRARWRSCLEHAFLAADLVTSENFYFLISSEALRWGEVKLASRAAMRGIHHPMAIIPPAAYFEDMIGHLWSVGRVADLETLLGVLHRREPEEPRVFNNHLYVTLLGQFASRAETGSEAPVISPQSLRSIVALSQQHPSEEIYRTTAALGLWMSHSPEAALRFLEEGPPRSALGETLLGLLCLELNDPTQAREVLREVDRVALHPMERAVFLNPLIDQLSLIADEKSAAEIPSLPQGFRLRSGDVSN